VLLVHTARWIGRYPRHNSRKPLGAFVYAALSALRSFAFAALFH
jgi:hypothetical protein